MLDDLLLYVRDQIAFATDLGCDVEQVWNFVQEFYQGQGLSTAIDEDQKQFLWKQLISLPLIRTYKNDDEQQEDISTFENAVSSKTRLMVDISVHQKTMYGDLSIDGELSENTWKLFKAIAASRFTGITQKRLSQDYDIPPRMVFHHLKPVVNNGMVIKTHVSAEAAQTNLCWHHHFAPKRLSENGIVHHAGAQPGVLGEPAKSVTDINALRLTVMKLIKTSPSQIMSIAGIIRTVYPDGDLRSIKHLRRHILILADKGHVKRIHIQDTEGKVHRNFVQYLRDYDPSISDTYAEVDLDKDVSGMDDDMSGDEDVEAGEFVEVNLLRTLSLERQFLEYIRQTDFDGTTTVAMHDHFNGLGTRTSDPIFTILENEMPPSCKHLKYFIMRDVVGKEHVNKFYNISVADKVGADSKTIAQTKKNDPSKASKANKANKPKKSLLPGEFTVIHEKLLPPSETFRDHLAPRPMVKRKPKGDRKVEVATPNMAQPERVETATAEPDKAEVEYESSEVNFQTMSVRAGPKGRPRKHPHLYYPDGIYVRSPEGRRRFQQEEADGICTLPPQPPNVHPLNYHTERPGLKRGRPKKKSKKKGGRKAVNEVVTTPAPSKNDVGTENAAMATPALKVNDSNLGYASRKRSRSIESTTSAINLEPPAKKIHQEPSSVDEGVMPDASEPAPVMPSSTPKRHGRPAKDSKTPNLRTAETDASTAETATSLSTPKRRGRPPKHLKSQQLSSVTSEKVASTELVPPALISVTPKRRGRPPQNSKPNNILPNDDILVTAVGDIHMDSHPVDLQMPEPSSPETLPEVQPEESEKELVQQRRGASPTGSPQRKRGLSGIALASGDVARESGSVDEERRRQIAADAEASMSEQTSVLSGNDVRPPKADVVSPHNELLELQQGLAEPSSTATSSQPMESLEESESISVPNVVALPIMQVDPLIRAEKPASPTVSTDPNVGPSTMEVDPPDLVQQPSTSPPAMPAEVLIKKRSTSPDFLDPSVESLQPKERLAAESPMKPVNKVSVAKRNMAIMEVLAENGDIMDAAELMQEVQKIYDELANQEGRPKQSIDKKTFSRSFQSLEQEDKVTVRILPFVGRAGRTIQKTFLVKSSLDLNGEFVKRFIIERAKKMQADGLYGKKPPELPVLHNVQLEMIESPHPRPQNEVASDAALIAYPAPQPRIRRKMGTNPELTKMVQISQQFGWRFGIFPRIKLLHQHLVGARLDGPKIFRGIDLTFGLPVEKYLRLFQLHAPQFGIVPYLKSMDFDMNTKVIDLEEEPRALLLSSPRTRDRHLGEMVEEMQTLGLIRVLGVDRYELQVEADLNKSIGLEPIIRSLRTPEEVAVYWSDLQVRALEKEDEQGNDTVRYLSAGASGEKNSQAKSSSVRTRPNMFRPQQWSTAWQLSAGQANFLRALIKNGDSDTPLKDEVRLDQIAGQTGLPRQDIIDFYQPIQNGFERARRLKEKQLAKDMDKIAATKARIAMKRREAENSGLSAAQSAYALAIRQRLRAGLPAFRAIAPAPPANAPQPGQPPVPIQQINTSQPLRPLRPANVTQSPSTWQPSSSIQPSNGPQYPSPSTVVSEETRQAIWRLVQHAVPADPHLAARQQRASTTPGTSKWRPSKKPIIDWSLWTAAKDEKLLKAYAIARRIDAGDDVAYIFGSIAKVFGHAVGPEACARRLKYLCDGKQEHSNRYAGLLEEYIQIWSAIYEDAIGRGVFRAQNQLTETFDIDEWIPYIAIGQQLIRQIEQEPRDLFSSVEEIERQLRFKARDHNARQEQATKGSDVQRKSGYLQYLISKKMNENPFVEKPKFEAKPNFDNEMARGVVFAVLSTEEEKFSEEKATKLLQRYDDVALKSTISSLLSEGVMNRTAGGIPGRKYRFGERVNKSLYTKMPKLFEQSAELVSALGDGNDSHMLADDLKGGEIAALLSFATEGRIRLDCLLTPEEFGKIPRIQDPFQKGTDVTPRFDIAIVTVENPFDSAVNVRPLPDSELQRKDGPNHGRIREVLELHDSDGTGLEELKSLIPNLETGDLYALIGDLAANGEVCVVGFDDVRIVASSMSKKWMVKTEPNPSPARTWYNIHGILVETRWRHCVQSVLECAILEPGIAVKKIQQNFASLLNAPSLFELLLCIERYGLIEQRAVKKDIAVFPTWRSFLIAT